MKKILLLLVLLISFTLIGCSKTDLDELPEDYGLSSVENSKDLKNLLSKTNSKLNSNWFFSNNKNDDVAREDSGAAPGDSNDYQGTDYTKTNVQVEGVDEGDIIKTDGSRIYSISHDRLQVVNLLGEGKMELILNKQMTSVVNKDDYYSYNYYSELYITDDYLVVVGQKYGYSYYLYDSNKETGETGIDADIAYPFYYRYTIMSTIDIYDIDSLELLDNYEISGYNLGTRLIENRLYLVSNHYVYNYNDEELDVRPWYKVNGEVNIFDYKDIKYIPDTIHQAFTVITTLSLDEEVSIDNDVFLAASSWGQIYVSKEAIYFGSNYSQRGFFGNYVDKGMLISYQFNKETGKVSFGGYGTYKGHIINQFAMDDYDGYMRLATTEGWGSNVKNRLYIFKRTLTDSGYTLENISLIDQGLGKPGERIQSVRFNKDVATIVTFLQTDPFYTIDLSDPYKPVISGELEVPGFSTYQHPWSDTLVLGIGFDANAQGMTTGMKISLYDISDLNKPVEVGKPLLLNNATSGWSFSEATYNHKAIMIDISHNVFGFTVNSSDYADDGYYKYKTNYLVFDVDATREQPVQVKHAISHYDFQDPTQSYYSWEWNFQIKRAFRVDEYLYVISSGAITSHNLVGEFGTVDQLLFNDQNN